MPWENLAEDLSEEFSEQGIDFRDNLRWIAPFQDEESRRNYNRWYHKFVRYPKHKRELLLKHKEWVASNRDYVRQMHRDYYLRHRDAIRAKQKARKEEMKKTPEGRAKLYEYNASRQRRYMAKLLKDPERTSRFREGSNQRAKAYRERAKQDPVKFAETLRKRAEYREKNRERIAAYKKAWKAKKKNGQTSSSGTGE